jgi:hypothetical protein
MAEGTDDEFEVRTLTNLKEGMYITIFYPIGTVKI